MGGVINNFSISSSAGRKVGLGMLARVVSLFLKFEVRERTNLGRSYCAKQGSINWSSKQHSFARPRYVSLC